jgi:hypothetical protein
MVTVYMVLWSHGNTVGGVFLSSGTRRQPAMRTASPQPEKHV